MIVIALLLLLTVPWVGLQCINCGISWSDSLIIMVLSCNGLYISKSVLFAEIQIETSGLTFVTNTYYQLYFIKVNVILNSAKYIWLQFLVTLKEPHYQNF